MIVKVVGNPDSHTTTIGGARLVQGVVFRKVGNDKKLSISLKKDFPDGFYKYSFDISTKVSKSYDIFFYEETGGKGFNSTNVYCYSAAGYKNGDPFNTVKGSNVKGGRFH